MIGDLSKIARKKIDVWNSEEGYVAKVECYTASRNVRRDAVTR